MTTMAGRVAHGLRLVFGTHAPAGGGGPDEVYECTICGARWEGAYDGIAPFWRRRY